MPIRNNEIHRVQGKPGLLRDVTKQRITENIDTATSTGWYTVRTERGQGMWIEAQWNVIGGDRTVLNVVLSPKV